MTVELSKKIKIKGKSVLTTPLFPNIFDYGF